MTYEQKENPRVTGEPYRFAQFFELNNGSSAEVYWLDTKKKRLGDIRLSLSYSTGDLRAFEKEFGAGGDDGMAFTYVMSPFFRIVMHRALGIEDDDQSA